MIVEFRHEKRLLDRKVGFVAIAVAAILFVPSSYAHEFGHALICSADGYSSTMKISNGIASGVTCDGPPSNPMLYWSFGGLVGMFTALSPLAAWKRASRNKGVLVGSFTIATMHAVSVIIETFTHSWYVTSTTDASMVVGASSGLAFTVFFILFGRK